MASFEERLSAVEARLGMANEPPFDRLSSIDLRLDNLQIMFQSFGLTQNQMDRKITNIETRTLAQDRKIASMDGKIASMERTLGDMGTQMGVVVGMLTQLIERDG